MGLSQIELLLALGFIVYRVAWLVANDEGPFGVSSWLRSRIDPNQRTWVGRGLNCAGCVSFWLALLAAIAFGLSWLDWLALAGFSCWLTRF